MAQLKLQFRIGRTRRAMRGIAAFDSRENEAIAGIHKILVGIKPGVGNGSAAIAKNDKDYQALMKDWIVSVAGSIATADTERAVLQAAGQITADLQNDLDAYARNALRFFTSQQSSTAGRPLHIQLDNSQLGQMKGAGFNSGIKSYNRTVTGELVWAPLAKSTLKRKTQNKTTYFVHTGDLKTTLARILPGAGGFFRTVINPGVKVTLASAPAPKGRGKVRVANVEVVLASSNTKGLGGKNVSFLRGDVFRGGDMSNVLMRGYLEKRVADLAKEVGAKLENSAGRRKQSPGKLVNPQRPWLEATMAYWILKRLPYVLRSSLSKHMATAMKG